MSDAYSAVLEAMRAACARITDEEFVIVARFGGHIASIYNGGTGSNVEALRLTLLGALNAQQCIEERNPKVAADPMLDSFWGDVAQVTCALDEAIELGGGPSYRPK